jgi:hypothetical protein
MNTDKAVRRLAEAVRRKHLALATERTYWAWLRRYCDFLKGLPLHLPSQHKLERFMTALTQQGCRRRLLESSLERDYFQSGAHLSKPIPRQGRRTAASRSAQRANPTKNRDARSKVRGGPQARCLGVSNL